MAIARLPAGLTTGANAYAIGLTRMVW